MARARQLVAQSGTLGERVDVWGSPDEGFIPPATTAYIASVLRELGYRVHEHLVPIAAQRAVALPGSSSSSMVASCISRSSAGLQ